MSDFADDFGKWLEEDRQKRENERLAFLDKCADKVKDNSDLIYRLLALGLCQRFDLKLRYDGEPPYFVWGMLNHYVESVDTDWDEWLMSDNAPFVRPISQVKRIFPELAFIYDDVEDIVKLANNLYGLDLQTDYDGYSSSYIYAYKFDFNSFQPLDVEKIKSIKDEKEVLTKYGYDTTDLDEELAKFGLSDKELEVI